jgi:hypothetical protein
LHGRGAGDGRVLGESVLEQLQELRSEIGIAYTRCCLGYADYHLGQASTSARHFHEALTLAHKIGRSDIMAAALEGLACIAASQEAETSALLLGAARRIRDDTGIHLTMIEGQDLQEAEKHAQSVLGIKQFAAATRMGWLLSLDESIRLAVDANLL